MKQERYKRDGRNSHQAAFIHFIISVMKQNKSVAQEIALLVLSHCSARFSSQMEAQVTYSSSRNLEGILCEHNLWNYFGGSSVDKGINNRKKLLLLLTSWKSFQDRDSGLGH